MKRLVWLRNAENAKIALAIGNKQKRAMKRFGSPSHIRNHALGKTASFFLDLLFHTWRYLEGVGEEPRHEMAKMFLS